MAIEYKTIISDPSSGDIYEIRPDDITIIWELNKEAVARFRFSFEEVQAMADTYNQSVLNIFSDALTEVKFYRNTTLIYLGVIVEMKVLPSNQGERLVEIETVDYFGLFNKRIAGIPVTHYTATDAGAIAWDLIDDSQNSDSPYSDWGITQGSITSSKNRDRTYRFDNIHDSIIALSSENLNDGFDFEIDVNKEFNVYYPTKGQDRPNVVFNTRTMKNYTWKKPLVLDLTNKVYVTGEGFNDDVVYETRTAATGYRSPFGTLEEVLQTYNVTETTTLQDKGDQKLTDEQEPLVGVGVEHWDDPNLIPYSDYNLGDTVRLDLPDLGLNEASIRVMRRELRLESEEGAGRVKLVLEEQ